MPIVASMGGNAGTQTMTVTVRALANDVVGHVARAGEATKVLQVDGILAGYVVFDYSVKASVSGDDMSDETQMAKRREQNTGCKTQMAKRNRKRNGKA